MSELGPLHRRLRLALDLSSLLVLGALAPACASTQDQDAAETKTKTTATATPTPATDPIKTEPIKPQPTPNPDPEPEPVVTTTPPEPEPEPKPIVTTRPPEPRPMPRLEPFPGPTCPTIDWCGPRALVEAMRPTSLSVPRPDVEGCPAAVEDGIAVDPKLLAGHTPPPGGTTSVASLDEEATKAKRTAGDADTCCYEWTIPCPGGRPLLIEGRPWLAGLQPGRSWSARLPEPTSAEPTSAPALPDHARERIAEGWLRDALAEHASIASFARARAELSGIAAPAELLDACDRAADDEVHHARLCFALAERFGGRALEPTALPRVAPRSRDPLAVALDTFVEGCVGETIAAACARRAASLATDPVVRAVLERIADDETEHAALAWRTLAWLIHREGPRVLAAVRQLAHPLRPDAAAPLAEDPDAPRLLAHGRLDDGTLARTRALAWRELVDPLLAALGEAPRQPPLARSLV